jgi:membrane protein implicated in regulation of membrane protease activity
MNTEDHNDLLHKMLMLSAWVQVLIGVFLVLVVGFLVRRFLRRRKN